VLFRNENANNKRRTDAYPMIAFFPSGKTPTDYSLIRINSSKKIALLNSYTKSTKVLKNYEKIV